MGNCCENKETMPNDDFMPGSHTELMVPNYNMEKQNVVSSQAEITLGESPNYVTDLEINPDSFYTGDFAEGKANGKGTLKTAKFTYTGDFVNGRPSGNGLLRYENGSEYEGDFVNGNCHGLGRFTEKDDFVYKGEFQNNRFHGKGVCRWNNGSLYQGEFFKGKFNGEGNYTYKDKKVFRGNYVNGMKHGEGAITFPGKTEVFKSVWKNGVMVGPSFLIIDGKEVEMKIGEEEMFGQI